MNEHTQMNPVEAEVAVSKRLLAARKARKFSREAVQEETGLHWDMIRRIEIGERGVEIGQLFVLCDLYEVSPTAIVGDSFALPV